MKQIFFLLAITLSSSVSISQTLPQLKLTPQGVEPIIVEVDSLKANEIYKKTLNWVQDTYKNPDQVLKGNIPNEKIRLSGFASNAWHMKSLGIRQSFDMEYTVEISFKDGKYKFEYKIGQFWVSGGAKALYDYTSFYKKTGEVRGAYSESVPSLESTMNNLSQSFYDYIIGLKNKKNDW